MGNFLIIFGTIVVLLGLLVNLLGRFGLPHLPGDILIERDNFTFYFPVVTSLVISIVLTVIINLAGRLFR